MYLDDFGMGYFNFVYLVDLFLVGLKMDCCFIRVMGIFLLVSYVVEVICVMVKVLSLFFVVEGVEIEM